MAEYLDLDQIRQRLADPAPLDGDGFGILKAIAREVARADTTDIAASQGPLDTVIRVLERREELVDYKRVLEALLRQVGLFPYLEPENLSEADQLAYEAHRPYQLADLVLHRDQATVYRRLLDGENIILSAPTSFGKSLIIDALLASGRYRNVVIIVPTIALIDETRRRLSRFSDKFKVITHPSQRVSENNVYVLTQERMLDITDIGIIDLFVIDEFYKLNIGQDVERSSLLNQAFLRLLRGGGQFFLLGPNIEGMAAGLPTSFDHRFIKTDFRTVASDITRIVSNRADQEEKFLEVARELSGPTLVYCQSPARVRKVASWLLSQTERLVDPTVHAAADWLGAQFHEEWLVVEALRHGIGVHHGRLPRSIAQWIVRAFNQGRLDKLLCTSTLIEGVNTRAKNIVILDRNIANQAYDYFTFNNIRGRSGRMFQHFVGRVILFHDPPQAQLPLVDIPGLSQSDEAPDSLLVQLDAEVMSASTQRRMAKFFSQETLSLDTLRANVGIDPSRQLAVARTIEESEEVAEAITWTGYPRYAQLVTVCDLIVNQLRQQRGMVSGVASGRQLAFLINRLSAQGGNVRALIEQRLGQDTSPDDAVEDTLDFLRYWPGHNFPRFLMAIDRIQREVLERQSRQPGNYSLYAARVESLFAPAPLIALEEYGIPLQVSRRLESVLQPKGDLDAVLERLSGLDLGELQLSAFERELIADAIEHL